MGEYTSRTRPQATPSRRGALPRETVGVSSKQQRRLTPKQERQRIEGLRILARIIARHYLANPELYANGAAGDRDASAINGPPPAVRETTQEEGAA